MTKESQLVMGRGETTQKDESISLESEFIKFKEQLDIEKDAYEQEIIEIEEIKEKIKQLELEILELEGAEGNDEMIEEIKIEEDVEQTIDQLELDNEDLIENELLKIKTEEEKQGKPSKVKEFLNKQIKRKFIRYVALPVSIVVTLALSYHSPKEYWGMYKNYKERHWEKDGVDDPEIMGIMNNDSINIENTTYDFLGDQKIEYKDGYYRTSVFDLSDRTPPKFKIINDRNNYDELDSAAGITTNLFKKFHKFSDFYPVLKGHENKNDKEIGEIGVIGYNLKNRTMKAGHLNEFNEDWLVSETYEIPLNFKLDEEGKIDLMYHEQALRMVPFTINENGKQIPFPIGVTYDKNIKKINPNECTRFGTLEGGKVIMVCGEKQLQVNGSFSDMFQIYKRLQKEYPKVPIQAYLLDNGSYNLPIWDNDNKLTKGEIKKHLLRNYDGGTALVLINDESISPYEYKNKYKEYKHYTKNFTKDSITGNPAINSDEVIVIHHTGNYKDPNDIIKQFQDTTTGTSAHVLIMKDGTRHLFNNDRSVLGHAGKSDFNNKNKVNFFSIGIELEGDSKDGNQFTLAQIESMLEYIHPRVEKYKIPFENITTHKIIRDNYIKKHPNEKDIPTKRDLDDKVWEQLQKLIQKKIYQDKKINITPNAKKMVSSVMYRDSYRITKNKDYSSKMTKAFIDKFNKKYYNISVNSRV